MRRPTGTDFLSAAWSVVLWYFGFLLIITGFHVTRASESGLLPGLTDCGIYYLVALVMHLFLARRIATVRGWRFWLMPVVTVPLAIVLILLLQWTPRVLSMLRYGLAEAGVTVQVFSHSLLVMLQIVPDIILLMYPFLIASQFLIRVLYRSAAEAHPAQAEG